jgi:hypothetical protein
MVSFNISEDMHQIGLARLSLPSAAPDDMAQRNVSFDLNRDL